MEDLLLIGVLVKTNFLGNPFLHGSHFTSSLYVAANLDLNLDF